eukprot:CAMPEP_0202444498 /NCGR_PEP_ID=MMETSP1360-20130828/3559_1 /ASSEMBLY_ACC=CAM_ASM_000848 /TAXON_ID=515479 /ORGANISM="Licmophora paradoxa, Strain CCMP2313" /LENGTH=155 /DNA_ID=CAMNT_0049060515 /DNA_START=46 /DNA_END=513 /DNA_ORIENTATION=-
MTWLAKPFFASNPSREGSNNTNNGRSMYDTNEPYNRTISPSLSYDSHDSNMSSSSSSSSVGSSSSLSGEKLNSRKEAKHIRRKLIAEHKAKQLMERATGHTGRSVTATNYQYQQQQQQQYYTNNAQQYYYQGNMNSGMYNHSHHVQEEAEGYQVL